MNMTAGTEETSQGGTGSQELAGERPLRRDAERNRQRILAAAAEVFTDRGLDATLDEVARAAGVGVGTVYRRFENKEQLIDALFDQRLEEIANLADGTLLVDDAWDALVGFLVMVLEQQASDRGLRELAFAGQHGRERVARARARIAPIVEQLVANALASGQLRADFVPEDMPIIQKMVCDVMDISSAVSPELWRRYLGMLLDGLRAERSAPTPLALPALGQDDVTICMRSWRPRRA
jgi:AcrR family transcriptional regulator